MKKNKFRRAQVTAFVIIAILLVLSVALVFMLRAPAKTQVSAYENPKAYMQNCLRPVIEDALSIIGPAGGFANLNPADSFRFNKTDIVMMCSTMNYEKFCVNEHPVLSNEIEEQIELLIKPEIEKCLAELKSSLSGYDYKEQSSSFNFNAEITPRQVSVNVDKKISYTKNEQTAEIDGFSLKISSPMFDFISISNRILNDELDCDCGAESCDAFPEKISMDNPDFEVTKPVFTGTGEEVYSIKEILSEKQFNFAIRNCVRRPVDYTGYG